MMHIANIFQAFLLVITTIAPSSTVQAANDPVSKTVCKLAVGYETVDTLQADLLIEAKREVINELFGELIVASTAVENFVVTIDQIRASSIGFVRVDGSADFRNGESFAEVCVEISAYVTEDDKEKFEPIKLTKKLCDSDNDMTTTQLISYVKDEAIIQALLEFNPKLKGADKESLLQLVQKVTYRGNGFIADTQTYCATFDGYVVPVEVMAFLDPNGANSISDLSEQNTTSSSKACTKWSLVNDFKVLPNEANPNPDSCNNPDVWFYMSSPALLRDPKTYSLLSEYQINPNGLNGKVRWGNSNAPWLGIYFDTTQAPDVRQMMVHPEPAQLIIVGWQSPKTGKYNIEGAIIDTDASCGDGISWYIDKESTSIMSGSLDNGGKQRFQDSLDVKKLSGITINKGEFLYLIVHPKGSNLCDTTNVILSIQAE